MPLLVLSAEHKAHLQLLTQVDEDGELATRTHAAFPSLPWCTLCRLTDPLCCYSIMDVSVVTSSPPHLALR